MKRKVLGFALLVFSLVLVFWNMEFNFTGNVVREYFNGGDSFWHLLGIAFCLIIMLFYNS